MCDFPLCVFLSVIVFRDLALMSFVSHVFCSIHLLSPYVTDAPVVISFIVVSCFFFNTTINRFLSLFYPLAAPPLFGFGFFLLLLIGWD